MTIKVLSCDRRRRHRSTLVLLFCRVVQRVILLFAFGTCTFTLYLLIPPFLFVCSSRLARPLFHAIHPKYTRLRPIARRPTMPPMPLGRPHRATVPPIGSRPRPLLRMPSWTHMAVTFSMGWDCWEGVHKLVRSVDKYTHDSKRKNK